MRLDRALAADVRTALRSRAVIGYLAIQLLAGVVFVDRRGATTLSTVLYIWAAMVILVFFAWWAGRSHRAHPRPDPEPAATARSIFALIVAVGMLLLGSRIYLELGVVLFACGSGAWAWAAWRAGGLGDARQRLLRDPLPFLPLWLLIAVPRLLIGGPGFLVAVVVALPSGIGQQLLYLIGLYSPLEAVRRRTDVAAVTAAFVFAGIHIPFVIEANGGDALASLANLVLFQASVGVIAVLAFVRHRAAVPIGVTHALAIA